jgi:hypothetical protein
MAKYGFAALNQNLNSNLNNGFNVSQAINQANLIKSVRVLSIVLNESHPRFKELGEWNGLGTIEYEDVNNPLPSNIPPTAKPLLSNNKKFPLVNEIVYLIQQPDTSIFEFSTGNQTYYLDVVSLWNNNHHNAYPANPNILPPSQQKDYVQTQAGNVRRVTDQSTEIFLGKTFFERSNIHPLLPFEGDVITEGRWGNSIRIGSTVADTLNNWSSVGLNGDPIFIIRNGQGKQTEEGWIPTVEDINNDDSSAYFTSTQKIPLKASSTIYDSYRTSPTAPDQYAGKQIILNSGRLVFNTTQDHILLSSAQTIGFNSVKGFNFDTKANFVVGAPSIKLGSKNATEPLLLGNKTVTLLNQLLVNLEAFMTICSTLVSTPPGTPLGPLNIVAGQMSTILNGLQQNLQDIKSKNNFTV